MLPLISLTLGLSFLCGLNLYLVTFLTSLAVQQGWISPALHPVVAALGHPVVLILALLFFLLEFIVDKLPWVDSLWDALHTLIRPLGAGLITWVAWQASSFASKDMIWLITGLGSLLALSAHLTKSGIRLLINASPEPFTNVLASLAEDLAVVCLFFLLIHAPVSGFAACLVLLGGTWIALPRLLRLLKTNLFLAWKKVTSLGRSHPVVFSPTLPAVLTLAQETQLSELFKSDTVSSHFTLAWTVPCVTGKIRLEKGLSANRFGTLVSNAEHPGSLVFLCRGWFRGAGIRISLAGCAIRQETNGLSENLVIHHAGEGRQLVFRFTRAEAALVATLVRDLRCRLGLDAPTVFPSTIRDALAAVPLSAGKVSTLPV